MDVKQMALEVERRLKFHLTQEAAEFLFSRFGAGFGTAGETLWIAFTQMPTQSQLMHESPIANATR